MDGYIVKSNRETGDGRSDIYIKPVSIFDKSVIISILRSIGYFLEWIIYIRLTWDVFGK